MRITVTADPYIPVPPELYGGIERVVDFLVRGLCARGHEVTLFAHPQSRTDAKLVSYGSPPHFGVTDRARELFQVGARLFAARRDTDVVHSFGRLAALAPVLPVRSLPKIQSYQRDRLPLRGIRRAVRLAGSSLRFTACSTHMYAGKPVSGAWSTVFNGVDLTKYTFVSELPADAPLVFLGRIERFKGVHHAIAIAKSAGRRLNIIGNRPESPAAESYFAKEVAPLVDGDTIRYLGPANDDQKNRVLGGAAALLMPIEWDEPFGIVMVEAMACGTPVIAFNRGSVSEVVRHGVNGFVCDGVEEAVRSASSLASIDRSRVREEACRRFASDVIVDAYERLYLEAAASIEG